MQTVPATFADVLIEGGARGAVALVAGEREVTYGELAAEVDRAAATWDLPPRSLIGVGMAPTLASVVAYLGVRRAGHVPLLGPAGAPEDWPVAATVTPVGDGVVTTRHPEDEGRDVHPELALLLRTSGSSGRPKLVRLSDANLLSNARAIAVALHLDATDRSVTTLPLHHCYGLSVLHSHLAVGGSVVLLDASVVDPCLARAVHEKAVTTLSGVPHSFELMEAAGPDRLWGPRLRRLTQAGGRMAPDLVDRWRARAEAHGVDLYVMYGQTEATARMAVLDPELAATAPRSVGRAVPGGGFRADPVPGAPDGVGELVYSGPNVMMGYALEPTDVARGAELSELRTGDLGRVDAEGVVEVIGRRDRVVKPFGVRHDLDALEAALQVDRSGAVVAGDDAGLVVALDGDGVAALAAEVVVRTGLPLHAVVAHPGPVPRTAAGKPDRAALLASARFAADAPRSSGTDGGAPTPPSGAGPSAGPTPVSIVATLLGRREVDGRASFVELGGDSLSYVEAELRLRSVLGTLPDDWHLRPLADLADARAAAPTRRDVDTTVVLRAVGIAAVVATHMHLWRVPGGAHLLLAVVGYNLSRFQLALHGAGARCAAVGRTIGRTAIPALAIAAVGVAVGDAYDWPNLVLANGYLGPRGHAGDHWHHWFIEAFVHLTLLTTLLLSIGPIRRVERARPYAFGLVLLAGAVALRGVTWWGIDDPFNLRFRTHGVAAFFVLGLLAHRATTPATRALTSVLAVACVAGFFDWPAREPAREAFVIGAIVLLVWRPRLAVPAPVVPVVSALAGASLWILLTHFHVWPHLAARLPLGVAYVATLAVGVGVAATVAATPRGLRRLATPCGLRRLRRPTRRATLLRWSRDVPATPVAAPVGPARLPTS